MKDKIESLENQVNSLAQQVERLQQKLIQLEAKFITTQQNSKDLLSEPTQPLESSKTTQQGNSNLNSNMGSLPNKSFQESDTNFHQAQEASFKSFSETSKIDFKPLSDSHSQQ